MCVCVCARVCVCVRIAGCVPAHAFKQVHPAELGAQAQSHMPQVWASMRQGLQSQATGMQPGAGHATHNGKCCICESGHGRSAQTHT